MINLKFYVKEGRKIQAAKDGGILETRLTEKGYFQCKSATDSSPFKAAPKKKKSKKK